MPLGRRRSGRGNEVIRIEGSRELRRALNKVDKSYGRELRDRLRDKVAEPVAARIRAKVPAPTGWWRDRIKAGATQKAAYVQWGRASVPYAAPVEFGGWPRGREFVKEGRYVWPTAREKDPDIERAAVDVYEQVTRSAGF